LTEMRFYDADGRSVVAVEPMEGDEGAPGDA
jgi:hypothetical protein